MHLKDSAPQFRRSENTNINRGTPRPRCALPFIDWAVKVYCENERKRGFQQKAIFVDNAGKNWKITLNFRSFAYFGAIFSSTLNQIVKNRRFGTQILEP